MPLSPHAEQNLPSSPRPPGRIRVGLCTAMRSPNEKFVFNYGSLRNEAEYGGEIEIVPLLAMGSNLPNVRTNLAERGLRAGCDYLFFIDDDQVVPPKSIPWLIQRERDVVAVNSVTKEVGGRFHCLGLDGKPIIVKKDSEGLVGASRIGFGAVLIRARVFRGMAFPWFAMPWDAKENRCIGEDDFFSRRAIESGFELFVDMDLSKYVGHFGETEFNYLSAAENLNA